MTRARRAHRSGYTLVELMIIVMIIAVSVLAFTPGFSRAMADRRVSMAARELIRIGRRARSDTFGILRAHLLWLQPSTQRIQLLRAPTNSCSLTNWVGVQGDCPNVSNSNVGAGRCVENVWLGSFSSGTPIGMFEKASAGTYSTTNSRAICYAPSGIVSYGSGTTITAATQTTALSTANNSTIGGAFVMALALGTTAPTASDNARIHQVLFPLGGSARALR